MPLRGLFIGIDRHQSSRIDELHGAVRDAVALRALFTDTLGGQNVLLANAEATRAGIEAAFNDLCNCAADDTVVISFSGHGSEAHQLVTYDTVREDLDRTTIPLTTLAEWFSRIPARRLILFLDCCFSGGMSAKVLQVETRARDLASAEERLQQLAGDGRLIVTASGPTEAAYENSRSGHGFFTYYLLEALKGAEEVVNAGKLSIYRLLEYVTRRVADAARQIGRPQTPTIRGRLDGDMTWPVFVPGANFLAAFPNQGPISVSAEIGSLVSAGFPQGLIDAWAGTIPTLNELQLEAINDFHILNGDHLVVSAPTSSGKTMIGELAALKGVINRKRALFLLPLKALVADKRRQFETLYGPYGVRTIEATGETDDISPLLQGRYDIGLLTYEKFAAIALTHPHIVEQVGVIVIDEAQMIADESRGANLEFILTLILMRRREYIEPQIIALSAVIGDTNGLERWLGARLLRRTTRPVPLDEGLLLGDGRFQFIDVGTGAEQVTGPIIGPNYEKGSSQDYVIPLVQKLVSEGQQVIVFREERGLTRGCANYLAQALGLPPASAALEALPKGDPSISSADLRAALARGVAFHNADLDREEKRAIEEEFRRPDATLRVIVATTTLAMGVNTPASSVVIAGLMHPQQKPYSVAEYKNIVGRAGRLGYAEKGTSYLLATDGRTQHDFWNNYVKGRPEDLRSRFLDEGTDPRSLIVRVLVAARGTKSNGMTADDILAFLEMSFGAFQVAQRLGHFEWSRQELSVALNDLARHQLIEAPNNGLYHLTALGRLAGESAIEVASILSLVDSMRMLSPTDITDPVLITAAQMTVELDQVLFPMNKKSTQKEPQTWAAELRRQGVPPQLLNQITRSARDTNQATMRAKKAAACLLFVSGRALSDIEATLTQFGGAFGGAAGPIRAVASRTCDFIPTAARVAGLLHPSLDLGYRVGRLTVRLTFGVSSAATELAQHAGAELTRGDYRQLTAAGLSDPDAIDATDDDRILECVDGDRRRLQVVRLASAAMRCVRQQAAAASAPILEPYVA